MGKRVLVIEPSRTLRKLLEVSLQQAGHQAVVFASCGQARQALTLPPFRASPPEVVLVAVQASPPESARFIEELRRRLPAPSTRIIAMLAPEEQTPRQLHHLLQDGQIISLLKPFRIQEVLALVAAPTSVLPTTTNGER